jgi:hypothetical protein
MGITVLQLHKRASYEFKHIQDKYAINSNKKTFALADGTTQSFNSEIWAELITKGFVANPIFNSNELINSFLKQVEEYKRAKFEFSTNPAKASLEKVKLNKGGTATFIGLQFIEQNKLDVISCGDTNLFLLNIENKIIPFPFADVDSLDANNFFINTEQLLQNKIDETFFKKRTLEYSPSDILIVATDALSRLILKKPSTTTELLGINTFEELHQFCLKYWENKELQEDDISAIIVPLDSMTDFKLISPPKDFSFPKEKEREFIAASLQQKNHRNYTDMEMNEIQNQFNGVAQDFHQVKEKLKLHEILLMVVISLLIINILLLYFLRPINTKGDDAKGKNKTENVVIQKKVEQTKPNQTISNEEAKKRQEELIKAGYKVSADGIWGAQSEKTWNEYQQKKKGQK